MAREDQIMEFVELVQPLSSQETRVSDSERPVTVSGTIVRGYQSGQVVEVQMDLTDKELQRLTSVDETPLPRTMCGWRHGIHVMLMSFLVTPAALCASVCVAFYMGTMTWYNVHLHFSEDRTIWHRILVCPCLILTFPFTVGLSALGVGLYAALVQLSWFYSSWYKEFWDFEKGFYGWVCKKCGLPQCSPYEVVILDESQQTLPEDDTVLK
ncbi:transmembrane protein 169-like [Gigantopelta aegis]|uniref:transmembrane protein 169-like n=1 Tax=Gigantopelta aegis TaxID=1735272 RepID=UPI001B88A11E|nr:transmembrane protein 169-like [Gigantopelta aegis]XP_041347298.1 transmembrane protein 169-like [Gigantopelta aegis]XP_041347299.1 transmembrane protein 169-like [Gigantopelta aegis]XP_041347300.1 transmembrane protein 169-like [Gigantopelta aegis]